MIKCQNACPFGIFTDNRCCRECVRYKNNTCGSCCSDDPSTCGEAKFDEESGLQTFKTSQVDVMQEICNIVTIKKQVEAKEKELKEKLKEAMEQYGIKKFSSDELEITYVPDGTRTTVDGTKLKKLHPEIAEECSKVSKTSAYVKVTVKGGDK